MKSLNYIFIFLSFFILGCSAPPANLCIEAAEHVEACTGEYYTPPSCEDVAAQHSAQTLLNQSCIELSQSSEKADGAYCDWFGLGCTEDEPIFKGGSCQSDSDCISGQFCVEAHCFSGITSLEFTQTLDGLTKTGESSGNSYRYLASNSESWKERQTLIAQAQSSIHFTSFVIQDDDVGRTFINSLVAAVKRGVEVRIMVDATTQYLHSGYEVLEPLLSVGGKVIPFNPILEWVTIRGDIGISANQRMHEKMLIVDGRVALVGGRNVGREYLVDGYWIDADVSVEGPAVNALQYEFLDLWQNAAQWEKNSGCKQEKDGFFCPKESLNLLDNSDYFPSVDTFSDTKVRFVHSEPRDQQTPTAYSLTLAMVRAAKTSIKITNAYFVPPRRLRRHLREAVKRGVDVRVITNSKESTDAWYVYYASLNFYRELLDAGVRIYQYEGTQTLHTKTMVVDDQVVVVGSFNLDPRSAVSNSELVSVLHGGGIVVEANETYQNDLAASKEVHYEDIPTADIIKAIAFRLIEPAI